MIKILLQLLLKKNLSSSGTLETVQENIISVRNARIENKQEFEEKAISKNNRNTIVNSRIVAQSNYTEQVVGWYDPLAQSFSS